MTVLLILTLTTTIEQNEGCIMPYTNRCLNSFKGCMQPRNIIMKSLSFLCNHSSILIEKDFSNLPMTPSEIWVP